MLTLEKSERGFNEPIFSRASIILPNLDQILKRKHWKCSWTRWKTNTEVKTILASFKLANNFESFSIISKPPSNHVECFSTVSESFFELFRVFLNYFKSFFELFKVLFELFKVLFKQFRFLLELFRVPFYLFQVIFELFQILLQLYFGCLCNLIISRNIQLFRHAF